MADGLLDARTIRQLADQLQLRPSKQRGQNFVIDPNTVRRIVQAAAIAPADRVLEIGPGLGSLTAGLLEQGAQVTAIEIEPVLAERLPLTMAEHLPAAADRLTVITADALTVKSLPDQPTHLVANLPYNVAVPVLLHALATFPSLKSGLVMVQLEVAERLVATPGSKIYGVPSVKLAWFAAASRAGSVPATVFWPRPKIQSGLVRFNCQPPPASPTDRLAVFQAIDVAFSQRRKMLRSALASHYGAELTQQALAAAGLDPMARGETLTITDYVRLAAALVDR
jgi:16S rRNA (adenine1518-N6/adenine1519-N6)-dimethyltransferase